MSPYGIFLYQITGSKGETTVGIVGAVPESIEPQFTRVLAGHHACPGWHGDGRDTALKLSVHASLHEGFRVGELI
jgi:hypothetical protein